MGTTRDPSCEARNNYRCTGSLAESNALMAAAPKRRRLKAALLKRAETELGERAAILEYVEGWVAGGGMISTLASSLQQELGESISRSFLSTVVHQLSPDATARITAARCAGVKCAPARG